MLKTKACLKGTLRVASDKSISHRAIILASISRSRTMIEGCLLSADTLATIDCFRQMGVNIEISDGVVWVDGVGLHGLKKPSVPLYVGNSGTTIRLLAGLLCGQDFETVITGDESILSRDMSRIIEPLRLMGADISGENGFAPLSIKPSKLKGIDYTMPIASAQVKSALLLAALYADGELSFNEPFPSRDHTERMLKAFSNEIKVPADISSAAYFLVASQIIKGSEIMLKDVCINDTRAGIIKVLERMGADLELFNKSLVSGEPICDIRSRFTELKATVVEEDLIPSLIDEVPIIAVAALFAKGRTEIRGVGELRHKESDRLLAIYTEFSKLGADIQLIDDKLIITGGVNLKSAKLETWGDHRIAMSLWVLGMALADDIEIEGVGVVDVSYPDFFEDLSSLFSF